MFILFSILMLLIFIPLIAVLWVVTVSCAIAWYEYANRTPALLDARSLPDRQWLSLRLMLLEAGAILLSIFVYPFGFLPVRPPRPTTSSARGVILLHGLFHNRAVWFLMKRRLEQCGFVVVTVNLPPWQDIDRLARRVEEAIDDTLIALDVERVDLVGHSMGGILARYYVQTKDNACRVDHCVLLGTPNAGSKLAPFAISPLGHLLMPGSDFLTDLAAAPFPKDSRFTSIYSNHDNIVIPSESAQLSGVDNLELDWLGHTTLLFHPDSHNAVVDALRTA